MSQELTVKENQELVPSYMQSFAGAGSEDISIDDLGRSFLKMVQKSSKEFDLGLAKAGDFFNSVSKMNHGNSVIVTVVKTEKVWRLFDSTNKLEAISTDGIRWDNGKHVTEEEAWKKACLDFFCVIEKEELPCIVSLSGTSFKNAVSWKKTIANFVIGSNEPIFARNYTIYSTLSQNEKGSYALFNFKLNSGFNSQEACEKFSNIRKMVTSIRASVSESEISPETITINSSEPLDLE